MTLTKSLLLSIAICGVSASLAQAEPMLSNNDGSWSFWSSAGNSVTPTTASARISAEPNPVPPPQEPPALTPAAAYTGVSTLAMSTSTPVPAPTPIPPGVRADAYLNFGAGPYPDQSLLTTGTAQPWYTSPVVTKYFGGMEPNAEQQAAFTNTVLAYVQQTFQQSGGLAPRITLDPSIPTNHTMSVVSGASFPDNPNAIGITNVGNNGFSFLDKLSYGDSLNELQWGLAHNISHELMHAFGVGGHDDQTGDYLDAAVASWDMLTNPATRFSDSAIADMKARAFGPNFGSSGAAGALELEGDMEILATPVPEPTTWLLWGLAASVVLVKARRQSQRKAL